MRRHRAQLAGWILIPMLGCAVMPATVSAQDTAATAKPIKKKQNLITEEEIRGLDAGIQTAFGVVQRLRPAMLRVRSGSTTSGNGMSSMDAANNEIQVFFDSQKMGGVRALEEIAIAQIKEIRYLSANDATTLFGTGLMAGAIQVISKR
jgi:outer membrane receptor protein involved in Fe transport